jgi:hypoxanthine phosphoribosyltransferase
VIPAKELERVRREAKRIYSAAEVRAALRAMAAAIEPRLAGRNPLVVAVMHGGLFTALHLSEQFSFPHEFDYVHLGRFGNALEGGAPEWVVGPKPSFRGRVVLLVDDVLDRGVTLAALREQLLACAVAELQTAVLVSKDAGALARPTVDYVGLHAGRDYLFGCGMDYKSYWRHLPDLYAMKQP